MGWACPWTASGRKGQVDTVRTAHVSALQGWPWGEEGAVALCVQPGRPEALRVVTAWGPTVRPLPTPVAVTAP